MANAACEGRQTPGYWLEPEAAIVIEGDRMRATSSDAWLRVDPPDALVHGRWLRLRYSSSYFDPIRPLIRFAGGRRHYEQVMNGPVLGSGEWIARVPDRTRSISISPVGAPGLFRFRLDSVERLARRQLVKRGVFYDRHALMQSIGAKIINAEEERWDTMRFAATATPLEDYGEWHRRLYRPFDAEGLDRPRSDWAVAPAVRLILALKGRVEDLRKTLSSLQAQAFRRWSLSALVPDSGSDALLPTYRQAMTRDERLKLLLARSSYAQVAAAWDDHDLVAIIEAGDQLPDYALAVIAEDVAAHPKIRLIYGDEDAITSSGELHSPLFKPDWSPVFFDAARYLGRLTCLRHSDLIPWGSTSFGAFIAKEADVLTQLAASIKPAEVRHIRRILYRRLRDSRVVQTPLQAATMMPKIGAEPPKAAIIIPTRDRADLLGQCLSSLEKFTTYPRYEIVIVDNGSKKRDALDLLQRCRQRSRYTVIERPGKFNFSALCNDGAAVATSDVLVFLNNDIVIFDGDWLSQLVHWAIKPEVGAVGAKLLFPDRTIEHAGVVLGHGGIAGHIHHREPSTEPGYMRQLEVQREVSAVTGACIAIERSKFEAVGRFDAENLPIDLNDIDLCLKAGERGWATVWTPHAITFHLQSASRGFPVRPSMTYQKERAYFRKRWARVIREDPFFHPALSLYSHRLALA